MAFSVGFVVTCQHVTFSSTQGALRKAPHYGRAARINDNHTQSQRTQHGGHFGTLSLFERSIKILQLEGFYHCKVGVKGGGPISFFPMGQVFKSPPRKTSGPGGWSFCVILWVDGSLCVLLRMARLYVNVRCG